MARFRKKPVEIEAVQVKATDCNLALPLPQMFDGCPFSEVPAWLSEAFDKGILVPHNRGSTDYAQWDIKTLEGTMSAGPGDWVIRGIKGELYFCKPDIFAETYDPVEGGALA